MPDGEKRKVRNDSIKPKKVYTYMSPEKRKFTMKEHKAKDKKSKATAAKARHDTLMRSTGRKKLATNYGKFAGEN